MGETLLALWLGSVALLFAGTMVYCGRMKVLNPKKDYHEVGLVYFFVWLALPFLIVSTIVALPFALCWKIGEKSARRKEEL